MKNTKKRIINLLKKCFIILSLMTLNNSISSAQNNSQFISITTPTQVIAGQTFNASVTFKNTGTTIWKKGVNNPHRLGSQNPQDNNSWGLRRVELPVSQVLPNATVTFNITATAPTTPGTYNFQWKMVQEVVEWFGAVSTNKQITVIAPTNNSQFISITTPTQVIAGQTFNASVTFKNTGTTIWKKTGNNPHRLGTQNPQDNNRWGLIRVDLPVSQVLPNATVTFNITATAPTTPGTYNFQWKMVQEVVEWFGAVSTNKQITVIAPTNNSQFISMTAPSQVSPGQTFTASLTFKNTGTTTWKKTGNNPHRLGTQNPQDNNRWGLRRVDLPVSQVLPNATVTFNITATAPATPGTYNFQWKMVQEVVEWFGAFSTNKQITVSTPLTNNSQFISITAPIQVSPGQTFTASVTFKNTGTTTWINGGNNKFRLGSENPKNNTYWGLQRVELPVSQVSPNTTVSFNITATAPTTPGTYNFQWRMIQEGVQWFGVVSTTHQITVLDISSTLSGNNSQFISMSAIPSQVMPGESFPVSITFKNTNSEPDDRWWWSNTALGSQNPENNMTWGVNRIYKNEMGPQYTWTNTNITFNFTATAPATPGIYNFQWRLLKNIDSFFGDITPNKIITVVAPNNNSEFISQNVPSYVSPGQTFTASITFKNTGTTIWKINGTQSWWLGSENVKNNTIWGTNRAAMVNTIVNPGETYTFTGTFIAPTQIGGYNFQWQMLQNAVEWFGEKTPNIIINVGSVVDDAKYIKTSILNGCSKYRIFYYKNTGNSIWKKGVYCLASENPPNNTIWGTNRLELPNDVLPGDTVKILGVFTTPAIAGYYPCQWRPSKGGNSRFGEITPSLGFNISGGYNSQYMGSLPSIFPTQIAKGGYADVAIYLKNTGTESWGGMESLIVEGVEYTGSTSFLISIDPGGTKIFYLRIYAPVNKCTLKFSAQLRSGDCGVELFGEKIVKTIEIVDSMSTTGSVIDSTIINVNPNVNLNKSTPTINDNLNNKIGVSDINIMPNPATNILKIKLPILEGKQILKIFDITGKLVYSNEYFNTGNIEVNISEFKQGIYFLKVENQINTYNKKIVIN